MVPTATSVANTPSATIRRRTEAFTSLYRLQQVARSCRASALNVLDAPEHFGNEGRARAHEGEAPGRVKAEELGADRIVCERADGVVVELDLLAIGRRALDVGRILGARLSREPHEGTRERHAEQRVHQRRA